MRRLLIVEDEPNLRAFLESLLSARYSVLAVEHRDAALLALEPIPHLILMDMDMPGLGIEPFLTHVRRECPDSKVVMMSGHHGHHEAARHGISQFLPKPFSSVDLLQVLRQAELG